jgi:hypothetical protein
MGIEEVRLEIFDQGPAQWPWPMVNLTSQQTQHRVGTIEPVTLSEVMLQTARLAIKTGFGGGTVSGPKHGRIGPAIPSASHEVSILPLKVSMEVAQSVSPTSKADSQAMVAVQTEEVNPGMSTSRGAYIGSHIQLEEETGAVEAGQSPGGNMGHGERDNTDPRFSIVGVGNETGGQVGTQKIRIYGPVQE